MVCVYIYIYIYIFIFHLNVGKSFLNVILSPIYKRSINLSNVKTEISA